jgi:hypothetical protein
MKKNPSRGILYFLSAVVAGAALFVLAYVELPPNLTIWTAIGALFVNAMILYAIHKPKKE